MQDNLDLFDSFCAARMNGILRTVDPQGGLHDGVRYSSQSLSGTAILATYDTTEHDRIARTFDGQNLRAVSRFGLECSYQNTLLHAATTRGPDKGILKTWQVADTLIEPDEVVIPFVKLLAEAYAAICDTCLGRFALNDFEHMVALIRASALFHQFQRKRDRAGRIIATKEDLRIVSPVVTRLYFECGEDHCSYPPCPLKELTSSKKMKPRR